MGSGPRHLKLFFTIILVLKYISRYTQTVFLNTYYILKYFCIQHFGFEFLVVKLKSTKYLLDLDTIFRILNNTKNTY